MADNNKVEYGVSNLHIGTYTEGPTGTITFGTSIALPGAVSLSLEPESDEQSFYADNVKYWSAYSDNGFTGTLEVARFTDEIKKAFFGYVSTQDGAVAKEKGAAKPSVYIAFQAEGDAEARRVILYNVSLGEIKRDYNTREENTEPTTESVDITVVGMNAGDFKLTMAVYPSGASGYSTVLTEPTAPRKATS